MRLLQVNLRTLLFSLLLLVVISIPVSFLAIRGILTKEVDKSLALHSDQFVKHIKSFEYLPDLEVDLTVWDQLSYDIGITPAPDFSGERRYQTILSFDSVEQEFRPFRTLSTPVEIRGRQYVFTVRMSLVDNDALVTVLATVQVIIVILLAIALVFLNRRLTQRLWRPFYQTLSQLKAYELDKNESFVPAETRISEFQDLNRAIAHLTDRNRKIFLQQKEFIENASHELQTPLAIFQSKLDVLMQNTSMDEQGAASIMELEETAQRMTRLNRNLLLLSKIDNDQFSESGPVDLALASERILNNIKSLSEVGEIFIDSNLQPLILNANATLIEILLSNLFHNAVRYAAPRSVVVVNLTANSLTVSNVGRPLKMSSDRIFDRFSKEGGSENSSGLGLAIVRKICDSYGYTVRYGYENGRHQFIVVF